MKQWQKKMVSLLALGMCFGLVACSSEESSETGSDSGNQSSSSTNNSSSSVSGNVEEAVEVEEAVSTEGQDETVEESGETEDDVALEESTEESEAEELVEATEATESTTDEAGIAEMKAYSDDLYEMTMEVLSGIAIAEVVMEVAQEDPTIVTEAIGLIESKFAVVDDFAKRTVPGEVGALHGDLVECMEYMLTHFIDIMYLVDEMAYMWVGMETMSEAELMAMLERMEEIMVELEAVDEEFMELDLIFETVGDEMDRILVDKLGQEYLDSMDAETDARMEQIMDDLYATYL